MAGPSDQYLAAFGASLGFVPPQPAGTPTMMLGQQQTQPMLPPPMPVAAPQPAPVPVPQPPPPVAAQPVAHVQPQHDGPVIGGAPMTANPDVQFRQVGGGTVTPAHEANTHGPKMQAAIAPAFEAPVEMANRIAFRSGETANQEEVIAQENARAALVRQDAAVAAGEARSSELKQLETDYRKTVQSLGQNHIDSNRWWSNQSTGDKIATGVMAFLGGLGALGTGGPNLAWQAIQRDMETDIEAQKFDYQTKLDQAKGAQNTFAMAMERYGSEDAATNMARVAALDFVAAKANEMAAKWKGTEAMNLRDQLVSKTTEERAKFEASGWKHVPAAVTAPKGQLTVRGITLPGLVTAAEANKVMLEHGVKPAEAVDMELVKGGVAAATKKGEKEGEEKKRVDAETRAISNQLQTAGVPQARASAERALAALNKSPGGKGEAAARSLLSGGVLELDKMVFSDDANEREQAYNDFMSAAMKATYGNVTAGEEVRAAKSYGQTGNPTSRITSINAVLKVLEGITKNAKAGAPPEAAAEFDRRLQAAEGSAPLVPKGVEPVVGWDAK